MIDLKELRADTAEFRLTGGAIQNTHVDTGWKAVFSKPKSEDELELVESEGANMIRIV